jgi:hypothetical protein
MDAGLQLSNANTTYASLLGTEDFSQHVKTLEHRDQLYFCQSIFHANNLIEQRSHELVFRAWEWIEQHQLYLHIQKTEAQYWQEVDTLYRIGPIVETERRKQNARTEIQSIWNGPLDYCLGPLCPPNPSRNLLEQLADFAKICRDSSTAKDFLRSRIDNRAGRSRTTEHIIVRDVEGAIQAYRSQQKKAEATRRNIGRGLRNASSRQSKLTRLSGRASSAKRSARQTRPRKSPNESPSPADASSEAMSDLSSLDSSIFESSSDESGKEDEAYTEALQRFFPFEIPEVISQLHGELDRLSQRAPTATWGARNLRQISRILMTAKPVTVYVEGVPAGVRLGLYVTSSREEADVLSLDDEAACDALADGPPDGKPVFIRNSNERRGLEAHEFLTYIERYRMSNIEVQDPTIPDNRESFQGMSPAEVARKLRQVLEGSRTVGYGEDQIPPYNLLSLPSLCPNEPLCLSKTEATRIHHLLRILNHAPGSPAPASTSWSALAAHLAISLSHQDHDGHGALLHGMFGYKLLILWPKIAQADRSKFLKDGIRFTSRGARYIVIGPHDQYIQTPCRSQDIHTVISLGYCGGSTCLDNCVKSGHPRCCGLVGMDGRHYWHAHFMADSVRSAMNELESDLITNQERHLDFVEMLGHLSELGERDKAVLGGADACQRFEEAKTVIRIFHVIIFTDWCQEYLAKLGA